VSEAIKFGWRPDWLRKTYRPTTKLIADTEWISVGIGYC